MNTKSLDTFAKEAREAGLFYAYAVLKGCRMKALITENTKSSIGYIGSGRSKSTGR